MLKTGIQLLLCFAVLAGLPVRAGEAAASTTTTLELVERAEQLVRTDSDASRRHAEQALKRLASAPDPELELRARFVLCDHFADQTPSAARDQIAKSLPVVKKSSRIGWKSAFVLCKAIIDETEGHSQSALHGYDEAVRLAEGAQDPEFLAYSLFRRGYLLGLAGEYVNGLVDLRRAHVLYAKANKPEHRRTVLDGIAALYNRMGDFEQAKSYYQQSIAQIETAGRTRDLGIALHNLGRVHENLKEWQHARRSFERALALHESIHFTRGMAYAHRGLASYFNGLGHPQAALREVETAEALSRNIVDARLRAQIHFQRGIAFRQLKRYPESISELQMARPVFEQVRAMFEYGDSLRSLAQTYAEAGQWRSAYDHEVASRNVSERLFKNQINQRFAWLKVEFDTNAKEQENTLLIREKQATEKALYEEQKANRLLFAVALLGASLLALLAYFVWRLRREHRASQQQAQTDELTGLPNRRHILALLTAQIGHENHLPTAVLIGDLDYFKQINDQFGHLVGDEILQTVAQTLRNSVPAPAQLGRLGGEEFLVILPGSASEAAMQIAEQMRRSVAAIDPSRWFTGRPITVSLGATISVVGRDTLSTILHRADMALYSAKDRGRNRCEIRLADY